MERENWIHNIYIVKCRTLAIYTMGLRGWSGERRNTPHPRLGQPPFPDAYRSNTCTKKSRFRTRMVCTDHVVEGWREDKRERAM